MRAAVGSLACLAAMAAMASVTLAAPKPRLRAIRRYPIRHQRITCAATSNSTANVLCGRPAIVRPGPR